MSNSWPQVVHTLHVAKLSNPLPTFHKGPAISNSEPFY